MKKINKILIITVLFLGLAFFDIPKTYAFFNATESSTGNTFTAGVLDIGISGVNVSDIVLPENSTSTIITISKTNPTNLDYQYFASTTITDTDQTACDYITILASSSPQIISVPLKNFISATSSPTGLALWDFTFTIASVVPTSDLGKICHFKISYTAWQTNLPNNSQGFSDVAEMTGSIQIGTVPSVPDVVLNEILPNPEGTDSDPMPNGEWVELYNNTNSPINLNGYYLTDADNHRIDVESCRIIGGNTTIYGKGFLVVYRKGIGTDCTSHNFELNDTGDTVNFYSPTGALIDFYTYVGSATDADSISDNTLGSSNSFTGTESPAQEGKSFARIPDGTGIWVDPIPTPGEPNKIEENMPLTAQMAGNEPLVEEIATTTQPSLETSDVAEAMPDKTADEAEPVATTTENVILDNATSSPEIITEPEASEGCQSRTLTLDEPQETLAPEMETTITEPVITEQTI